MKKIQIITTFLIVILIFPSSVLALRCGTKLVNEGDRKIEVVEKCGEPALIERWQVENTTFNKIQNQTDTASLMEIRTDQEGKLKVETEYIEEWTYNFGANDLIHFLLFTNGMLTDIQTGSRGFAGDFPTDFDKTRCGKMVELEDRKIDVMMKCGEPVFVETRIEEVSTSRSERREFGNKKNKFSGRQRDYINDNKIKIKQSINFQDKKIFKNITEWNFNFGPHYFLEFVTFENGKVTKIEHGDYGYE